MAKPDAEMENTPIVVPRSAHRPRWRSCGKSSVFAFHIRVLMMKQRMKADGCCSVYQCVGKTMNIPNAYKKVVDGFLIQPRSFTQMLSSALRGAMSLLNEQNRSDFIEKLDKGIINEAVISQANTGPVLLLSLFHDLQNPLFKRYKFDATDFLEGVAPALERFHNVSGALENEFHKLRVVKTQSKDKMERTQDDGTTTEGSETDLLSSPTSQAGDNSENSHLVQGEERQHVLDVFRMYKRDAYFASDLDEQRAAAILNHDWNDDANENPESLAAQLSCMLTKELFQMHQLSAKASFVLQNHQSQPFLFEEGTCAVNNVALLSARAILCDPLQPPPEASEGARRRFEDLDAKQDNVAAQLEVLYDVSQRFTTSEVEGASTENDAASSNNEPMTTTIVSVATIEGWLSGGEDGELRWRLALHRPAYEFPGIPQPY